MRPSRRPGQTVRSRNRARAAAEEALRETYHALRANDHAFQAAQDQFVIEQLIFEHAALECRCRALLRELRRR